MLFLTSVLTKIKSVPRDKSTRDKNGMAQKSAPSCALSKMHRRTTFWTSTAASLRGWYEYTVLVARKLSTVSPAKQAKKVYLSLHALHFLAILTGLICLVFWTLHSLLLIKKKTGKKNNPLWWYKNVFLTVTK